MEQKNLAIITCYSYIKCLDFRLEQIEGFEIYCEIGGVQKSKSDFKMGLATLWGRILCAHYANKVSPFFLFLAILRNTRMLHIQLFLHSAKRTNNDSLLFKYLPVSRVI